MKGTGEMANEDNLRALSTSEAREIGRKGGIASGEARRKRKLLKDCLNILLETEYTAPSGEKVSGADRISARLFKSALEGDLRAFEIIRDTVGQKPVERVETVEISQETYERVARMLEE